jgi:hypothetical protein
VARVGAALGEEVAVAVAVSRGESSRVVAGVGVEVSAIEDVGVRVMAGEGSAVSGSVSVLSVCEVAVAVLCSCDMVGSAVTLDSLDGVTTSAARSPPQAVTRSARIISMITSKLSPTWGCRAAARSGGARD